MRNYYKRMMLFLVLLLSMSTLGQIAANDDFRNYSGSGGDVAFTNVLINDTLNGSFVNASQVTVTFVSSTNSGLSLSGTNVLIAAGTPLGNYTLTYQICEVANPNNCDIGIVTINYNCIQPSTPIIGGIIQPNCTISSGSVVLSGLPSGAWSINQSGTMFSTYNGSGSTYTISGLPSGNYVFNVVNSNGCQSSTSSTVTIAYSVTSPPTFVPQTCTTPSDSLTLNNLPSSGTWTLSYRTYNTLPITISGSGSSYTFSGLAPNSYYFKVTNSSGCTSNEVSYSVGYLSGGISGTLSGLYVDYNNDGITNIGDVIQYTIPITNNLSCPMETVTYSIQSVQNTSGTILNLNAGATENGILNYPLTQNDINNGNVFNWIALVGFSNGYNNYAKVFNQSQTITLTIADGIKLNAFFDTNNNGVQDASEINAIPGNFIYQLNNDGVYHSLNTQDGSNIIYETNPINSYDLNYSIYNNCTGQYTVSSIAFSNISVPAGSGITTYNFPIVENPCKDLQIFLTSSTLRPGFECHNFIHYRNVGNQTIPSGTLTFNKDNVLSISSISQTGTTATASGFTYNFTNMLPNEWRTIDVTMQVPTIPTVAIGQVINNTTSISIPTGDIDSTNNSSTLTQAIVGAYDPNDKTESHGGKIVHSTFTANDYLTYTIHFENIGTANAINVRVNDLLDEKLDENSIRMVRASHPYVLDRVGNNLNWNLNGINLPPSIPNDENTGKGYIVFQVKPKPGYAIGDIIPNSASIYFDFNPAIVTEPCITEFVNALSTNTFALNDLQLYPNPAKNKVSISNRSIIDTVAITSVLGQEILHKKVNDLQTEIDLASFANGIYFVKVSSNKQEKIIKIVKE